MEITGSAINSANAHTLHDAPVGASGIEALHQELTLLEEAVNQFGATMAEIHYKILDLPESTQPEEKPMSEPTRFGAIGRATTRVIALRRRLGDFRVSACDLMENLR